MRSMSTKAKDATARLSLGRKHSGQRLQSPAQRRELPSHSQHCLGCRGWAQAALLHSSLAPQSAPGWRDLPWKVLGRAYLRMATVSASGELAQGQMASGLRPRDWKTLRKASQEDMDPGGAMA